MKEGLVFMYDGVSSEDMGLYNVSLKDGLFEETFLAPKNINEVKIRGRDKPYFVDVEREPLSFELTFAFKDQYDQNKIREVARWLDQDYYREFYVLESPNRIYYCMLDGDSELVHNGLKRGYITLKMRCDSPYSYSPVYETKVYDFSTTGGGDVDFTNYGDLNVNPEVWIEKVGNGDISISNLNDNSDDFKFVGAIKSHATLSFTGSVSLSETVTIDTQTYEFDDNTGVATGNIAVNLDKVANPSTAPTLGQTANANSTLPAGTYYVVYTWVNIHGETMVSPESNFTTSAGYDLNVTLPTFPTGVGSANIYISTTTGTETKQGSTTTTSYAQSSGLVAGSSMPSNNTTTNLTVDHSINKLVDAINSNTNEIVDATGDTLNDTLKVTSKIYGDNKASIGEVVANASWDSTTLHGWSDGLYDGETVYVDSENEYIETDLIGEYRYDSFSDNYLNFKRGTNNIKVTGFCKIKFRYQYKILQG